jgi:hypothetical protein
VKKAFPYIMDFVGGFLAYTLWTNDYITVIGVIAIIVSTALLSTCWILYFETEE